MDDRAAALARAVAETVDAWLRDPRDAALYVRLLTAVEAWRARLAAIDSASDVTDERASDDVTAPVVREPAHVSASTAALLENLRRLQADAHRREHPTAGANAEPPETDDTAAATPG